MEAEQLGYMVVKVTRDKDKRCIWWLLFAILINSSTYCCTTTFVFCGDEEWSRKSGRLVRASDWTVEGRWHGIQSCGGAGVEVGHSVITAVNWQLNDRRERQHFKLWQFASFWFVLDVVKLRLVFEQSLPSVMIKSKCGPRSRFNNQPGGIIKGFVGKSGKSKERWEGGLYTGERSQGKDPQEAPGNLKTSVLKQTGRGHEVVENRG